MIQHAMRLRFCRQIKTIATRSLVLFACLTSAFAAGPTLIGTVAGHATGPIDGAKVTAFLADGKGYRASTSAGQFTLNLLSDGQYFLLIEAAGQRPVYGALRLDGQTSQRVAVTMLPLDSSNPELVGAAGEISEPAEPNRPDNLPHKITAAKLSKQVKPRYPAAERGRGGAVKIATTLRKDGTLDALVVLSAPSRNFALAALAAVREWRYTPTLLDGKPVEVTFTIDVNFEP